MAAAAAKQIEQHPETKAAQTAAEKSATISAESKAKAIDAMPAAEQRIGRVLGLLDDIVSHPNLSSLTGWENKAWRGLEGTINNVKGFIPFAGGGKVEFPETVIPETENLVAKIKQVQGNAFLQAFESLKGAGAITEKEGEKATEAMNRLGTFGQSDKGYREALMDARREMYELLNIVRQKAGVKEVPAPSTWDAYEKVHGKQAKDAAAAEEARKTSGDAGALLKKLETEQAGAPPQPKPSQAESAMKYLRSLLAE